MNRRSFLNTLKNVSLSALPLSLFLSCNENDQNLKGKILTIGENYKTGDKESLVTKVDLSTKRVSQKVIPIRWGHMVSSYKKDELLACGYSANQLIVLDSDDLSIKRKLNIPKSYVSSGHFLIQNKKLYVGLYPQSYDKTAALLIKDLDSESTLKIVPFKSYGCHDIVSFNSNQILVSLTPSKKDEGFLYPDKKGGLALFDTNHDTLNDLINVSYNGSPDHLEASRSGNIFLGITQFIPFKNKKFLESCFKNKYLSRKDIFNPTAIRQEKIGIHRPLVKLSISKNQIDTKELHLVNGKQQKILSFAKDESNDKIFMTCGHSNQLICFNSKTGELIKSWDGSIFNLNSLQGVCILNENYIAVSGDKENIVIYSTRNERIFHTFVTKLHSSTHLSIIEASTILS